MILEIIGFLGLWFWFVMLLYNWAQEEEEEDCLDVNINI